MIRRAGLELKLGMSKFGILKVGMPAAVLALLLLAGSFTGAATTYADECTNSAIAFGVNDSDNQPCADSDIFVNVAEAANANGFFSFANAYSHAETDAATIPSPTYAWAYNTNSVFAGAIASNDVHASNMNSDLIDDAVIPPGGSISAQAWNTDVFAALAVAENDVNVDSTDLYDPAFALDVFSRSENTRCSFCEATSVNNVDVSDVRATDISMGTIYARSLNQDATFATANAYNNVHIEDVTGAGVPLLGDESGNGTFAVAENLGGVSVADCVACFAVAYNSLDITNVLFPSYFMKDSRAAARNEYSSGASAIAINEAEFGNIYELFASSGLEEAYGYAFNTWSPDSSAVGVNLVHVRGDEDTYENGIMAATISGGSLWSEANNYYCYECVATAINDLEVTGAIQPSGSIFGGGAYAYAFNEGQVAPGFGENTAIATNTAKIEGDVTTSPDDRNVRVDIVSGGVYSFAHNYTGDQQGGGYCYECVAVADNSLRIADSTSGGAMVDTSVFATAENYNSNEVLAKSKNKLVIDDTDAFINIITSGTPERSGVFAYTTNRYCDECKAAADNFVLIKDVDAGGTVLNGSAFAWAENYLDDTLIVSGNSGGSDNTAVAYNTLIIKDNGGVSAFTPTAYEAMVNANIYSCASNNIGGSACEERVQGCGSDVVVLCSQSEPSTNDVSGGACVNCQAFANNVVTLTGDSRVLPDSQIQEPDLIDVFARAENSSSNSSCIDCTALATNSVNAEGASTVNGQTGSDALNVDSVNSTAISTNSLKLDTGNGHAETLTENYDSTDSTAIATNEASASSGGNVESSVSAANTHSESSYASATGTTTASNGGNASNNVMAETGGPSQSGNSGTAIAIGTADANGTDASTTAVASLFNDGTSSGAAFSMSFDENGNFAMAMVATDNGDGVAFSYATSTDGSASAVGTADGSATQGGDVNFQTGDPTASTDVSPTAP